MRACPECGTDDESQGDHSRDCRVVDFRVHQTLTCDGKVLDIVAVVAPDLTVDPDAVGLVQGGRAYIAGQIEPEDVVRIKRHREQDWGPWELC